MSAPEPFIPFAVLRAPIVGATAVAGFFRSAHHWAHDLHAGLFRAGAGFLAERLRHRTDRVPGGGDRRLVHCWAADGAARHYKLVPAAACCSVS